MDEREVEGAVGIRLWRKGGPSNRTQLLHQSQDLSRQHSALYGCYTKNSQARGYGVHQSRDACEQKYDQFGRSVDRIVVASGSIRKSMLPAATLDERTIVLFITQVLGLRCLRDIRAFDQE